MLSGQSFMYLHYADMIANGYHRTMPCPFQSQGLLLNPNGDLHYCENSQKLGNVLDARPRRLYFRRREPRAPRAAQERRLPHLPEPVPGQRRRDEAVRALREVPEARLPGQARTPSGTSRRCRPSTQTRWTRGGLSAPPSHPRCRRPDGDRPLASRSRAGAARGGRRRPALGIAAAVLLVLIDRALMALRWMDLLCALTPGSRPPFATSSGSSSSAHSWARSSRASAATSIAPTACRGTSRGSSESAASVLMDRVLGVLSMAIVGAVAAREPSRASVAAWRSWSRSALGSRLRRRAPPRSSAIARAAAAQASRGLAAVATGSGVPGCR